MSKESTTPPVAATSQDGAHSKEVCAVCLQSCVLPVTLPCSHIFCYLCVKGFASRSRCCALCRCELPRDFCDRPHVLDPAHVLECSQKAISSDGCQWYYSGANGWWQYEERIAKELEEAFAAKHNSIAISVSGFQYIVDFVEMVQYKESDPNRRRRVKRDATDTQKKGVAGILLRAPAEADKREEGDRPRPEETPQQQPQEQPRRRGASQTRRRPRRRGPRPEEEAELADELANLSIDAERND